MNQYTIKSQRKTEKHLKFISKRCKIKHIKRFVKLATKTMEKQKEFTANSRSPWNIFAPNFSEKVFSGIK